MGNPDLPRRQGLYDPAFEHDACGVAFVVDLHGRKSPERVRQGLPALCHLAQRGASGSEVNPGDGAGITIQVPDRFLREAVPFDLPPAGQYATGIAFLPAEPDDAAKAAATLDDIAAQEGVTVLGWRDVPTDPSMLGSSAAAAMPIFRQWFVAKDGLSGIDLDRWAYVVRKRGEHEAQVYFPSLSSRIVVYKGMLTTHQLEEFFPELTDERVESALALVHSRFSTNTFPSWPLAHPYRYIAHNGEINTVQGNRNWMRAREALLESDLLPGDLERIFPICTPGASDTASFDEVLELLHLGGRPLPHAVLMMIPEPWENHESMSPERKAFYRFHSSVMEPWDGPASIAFTDGTVIGAVLDRNGLRPSRYWVTKDDLVIMASEVGVLDIPAENIVVKERLHPGRIFLVDTAKGRIVADEEIKSELALAHPYEAWLKDNLIAIEDVPAAPYLPPPDHDTVVRRQRAFGYTQEDLRMVLGPMATGAEEPVGSMGTDTPLAVLSERPRLLYDYFKQLFAQVTNPPLDAIREELVTSMASPIGPERNLLKAEPESCRQIGIPDPIIDNDQLAKLRHIQIAGFRSVTLQMLYRPEEGGTGLAAALDQLCLQASAAVKAGHNILILSDRGVRRELAPIPSLLATAGVHHHLVREGARTRCALVLESGDAREVHHVALLIGYGAGAVNPYLAFESLDDLIRQGALQDITHARAVSRYIKGLNKGILKVMSKMGISTLQSYCGAQIFEAIGLDQAFVDRYFTSTASRIGGVGIDVIAEEVRQRHGRAFPSRSGAPADL